MRRHRRRPTITTYGHNNNYALAKTCVITNHLCNGHRGVAAERGHGEQPRRDAECEAAGPLRAVVAERRCLYSYGLCSYCLRNYCLNRDGL